MDILNSNIYCIIIVLNVVHSSYCTDIGAAPCLSQCCICLLYFVLVIVVTAVDIPHQMIVGVWVIVQGLNSCG